MISNRFWILLAVILVAMGQWSTGQVAAVSVSWAGQFGSTLTAGAVASDDEDDDRDEDEDEDDDGDRDGDRDDDDEDRDDDRDRDDDDRDGDRDRDDDDERDRDRRWDRERDRDRDRERDRERERDGADRREQMQRRLIERRLNQLNRMMDAEREEIEEIHELIGKHEDRVANLKREQGEGDRNQRIITEHRRVMERLERSRNIHRDKLEKLEQQRERLLGRDDRPREGDRREGDRREEGRRDGEVRREGDRPREGDRREEGRRDGEVRREGDRPREGDRREEGRRDGEVRREGDRPREGDRREEGRRDGEVRREGDRPREGDREHAERGGVVTGQVTAVARTWIAVRADGKEESVRYMPRWVGGDRGGLNEEMLKRIRSFRVGTRVRLKWVYEERPRVLDIAAIALPVEDEG